MGNLNTYQRYENIMVLNSDIMAYIQIVRIKSDPLAAFTFRAQRESDPIRFEITGWTAREGNGSYRDTVVKTTALTTIVFITNG